MAKYGHLKPDQMHAELKSHYEAQPKLFRGADADKIVAASAADYKTGHDLVEKVKSILNEIGSRHQDEATRKHVDLAINSLHEATTAFGNASLVQNNTWNGFHDT